MSKTNTNHIQRQWQVIQFLVNSDNYVSTQQILDYLISKGYETDIRTVQRDLKQLENSFPLECRREDKPYSWRWQRLKNTQSALMSYEQALIFRIIEQELEAFIPTDLMARLEPVLMRARLVVAGLQTDIFHLDKPAINNPHWNDSNRHDFFIPRAKVFDELLSAKKSSSKFKPKTSLLEKLGFGNLFGGKHEPLSEADKLALQDLEQCLSEMQLTELSSQVSRFHKQ